MSPCCTHTYYCNVYVYICICECFFSLLSWKSKTHKQLAQDHDSQLHVLAIMKVHWLLAQELVTALGVTAGHDNSADKCKHRAVTFQYKAQGHLSATVNHHSQPKTIMAVETECNNQVMKRSKAVGGLFYKGSCRKSQDHNILRSLYCTEALPVPSLTAQ